MVTYPKDWTESKLLDHVDLVQGLTYTPENVKPSGTLVLRSSNIQNGTLSLLDNVYVNVNVPEEKMVQPGDILVCVRNGSSALIGKSCILPGLSNTTIGAFMSVLRGDTSGFFAKLFESDIVQEQVRGRSNATINQITKKDFQSIEVTVPSEPEQKDIAQTLGCFDAYIANLMELIEKKRGIRDGALEDLMSGRTRLDGFHDLWHIVNLKDITSLITKGTTPLDKSGQGTVHFVKVENIDDFSGNITITQNISEKENNEYLKRSQLEENDILFSIAGTLGRIAIVDKALLPANTNQALAIIRLSRGNHYFISYYLKSKAIKKYIQENPTVGAQPNLSLKQIRNLTILFPSEKEQVAIAETLKTMDDEIEALEVERDKMIQIREGAMDDLLTGRVRLSV